MYTEHGLQFPDGSVRSMPVADARGWIADAEAADVDTAGFAVVSRVVSGWAPAREAEVGPVYVDEVTLRATISAQLTARADELDPPEQDWPEGGIGPAYQAAGLREAALLVSNAQEPR